MSHGRGLALSATRRSCGHCTLHLATFLENRMNPVRTNPERFVQIDKPATGPASSYAAGAPMASTMPRVHQRFQFKGETVIVLLVDALEKKALVRTGKGEIECTFEELMGGK